MAYGKARGRSPVKKKSFYTACDRVRGVALRNGGATDGESCSVSEFLLPFRYGICVCHIYITMKKVPNVVSDSQSRKNTNLYGLISFRFCLRYKKEKFGGLEL